MWLNELFPDELRIEEVVIFDSPRRKISRWLDSGPQMSRYQSFLGDAKRYIYEPPLELLACNPPVTGSSGTFR
jgi:hypothetical protein